MFCETALAAVSFMIGAIEPLVRTPPSCAW
jgi:hypothetical protein